MPQRLNETWEAELGPTAVSIHEQYLHTIGNLTLTGMNESMGNSAFGDKKKVFAGSNFALNKDFSQQTKWDQSTILERSKTLGKLSLTIWTPTS